MATTEELVRKQLIKRYHMRCRQLGLDAETKEAMLGKYGVDSSRDMTVDQLMELCGRLDRCVNPKEYDLDKKRKQVIAAIGGWLRLAEGPGPEPSMSYIKGVACRAAGVENFNRISLKHLTSIYNLFRRKQKDAQRVNAICGEMSVRAVLGKDGICMN